MIQADMEELKAPKMAFLLLLLLPLRRSRPRMLLQYSPSPSLCINPLVAPIMLCYSTSPLPTLFFLAFYFLYTTLP